jgi:FkbM family methyltransferase
MKVSRRKFEELTWILGLHHAARRVYQATVGRQSSKWNEQRRRFYSQLLGRDQLAFDIGANVGQYAEAMESAGARVVAVEPNSDCLRHIEIAYAGRRIEAIHAVVGAHDGLAKIRISDGRDDISTLSEEWMNTLKDQHQEYANLWNKTVTIPMVSLNTLRNHFGDPDYIKIDVEGFEESVLDGLSFQPSLLSFEFNLAFPKAAIACVEKSVFSSNSTFNYVWGANSDGRFELAEWTTREKLIDLLVAMPVKDKHGDIFIRASNHRN